MTAEPITQEKPPKFQAVPVTELPKEQVQDSAPKRPRGRPPGSGTGVRKGRRPRSLETQLGAALVMANMPLMLFAADDMLDDAEITALAKAIDAQCQNSPRFRKYVQAALDASSGGQLITVTGIIVARRMARHEFLLPKAADAQLGSILGSVTMMPAPEPETLNDGAG